LQSPFGGAWESSEVDTLEKPSKSLFIKFLDNLTYYEYSVIFFSGHGSHSEERRSTILELNKDEIVDSMRLRTGYRKRTIILDCCRKVVPGLLLDSVKEKSISFSETNLDRELFRFAYDLAIENCPESLILAHSCSSHEFSYADDNYGSYYTFSLLRAAKEWLKNNYPIQTTPYSIQSIVSCHNDAIPRVQELSNNKQNPYLEKTKSSPYFPFSVVV
jgi:hypothetical protein